MEYENPLISIITVVFNNSGTLELTIKSVMNQEYSNFEYIIIDGGSTDGTLEILKKYENQSCKYLSESDYGIYDAMNKGIGLAKGQWLYFLGSDDILYDRHVLRNIFSNPENNKYDIIYGDVLLQKSKETYGGVFNEQRLMYQNICHQSIFYRDTIFRKYGKFDIRYSMLADWEFNLRWFSSKHINKLYIKTFIAKYNEIGSSSIKSDLNFQRAYYKLLLNNFSILNVILFLFNNKIFKHRNKQKHINE